MSKKQIILLSIALSVFINVSLSQVNGVDAIGITVKEMDRSLKFYTDVLGFKKISDAEYTGEEIENLLGLFGIHTRVARLQLGDEFIELTKKIGLQDNDLLISLGDIVDRGNKSKEVYEYFVNRPNSVVLMGNHERKHQNKILS